MEMQKKNFQTAATSGKRLRLIYRRRWTHPGKEAIFGTDKAASSYTRENRNILKNYKSRQHEIY
jgi:hypothetical protein